jgi:hypothetical protein
MITGDDLSMNANVVGTLNLQDLGAGIPALTEYMGGMMRECCMLCLEDSGHHSGVEMQLKGSFNNLFTVHWTGIVDDQMRDCYGDPDEVTEQAACGIALLLIPRLTGHVVIGRSFKGTGFDYWIGEASDRPFKRKARLEISGIRQGDDRAVRKRVDAKKRQTDPSDGSYPAYVAVVEFSRPLAQVEKK